MGLFEATFSDGKLIDLRFCKNGSSLNSEALWTSNIVFLRAVKETLNELFEEIDSKD